MAMKYAIVCFEDNSYSEVPISWVCDNNQNCWWPKTKNVTSFIIKGTDPVEEKWEKHKIVIHEYCDSWDKARKRAEDISCTDSEDVENKGRGKRKVAFKRSKIYEDDSSADDSSDSCMKRKRTLPLAPKLNTPLHNIRQDNIMDIMEEIGNVMPSVPEQIFQTVVTETLEISRPSTSKSRESSVCSLESSVSQVERSSVTSTPSNSKLCTITETNEMPRPSTSKSRESSVCSLESSVSQIERSSVTSTPRSSVTPRNSVFCTNTETNVDNYFKRIMDTLIEIKMEIHSLKNKAGGAKIDATKFQVFTKYFPIKDLETFNTVNAVLLDNSTKNDFVCYIRSYGGSNVKDSLNRILRQIFSNSFATNCSWLGLRNNMKLDGTVIINILRDFSVQVLEIQHKEFEIITAEWFRHAQQRLKRKKENE